MFDIPHSPVTGSFFHTRIQTESISPCACDHGGRASEKEGRYHDTDAPDRPEREIARRRIYSRARARERERVCVCVGVCVCVCEIGRAHV